MDPTAEPDSCYLALKARDARFDGRFFTGVTSTGIYCRPICSVRTPKRENCRFFAHPALAERAGFRPCRRCRPELAPRAQSWSIQDASAILARQAARLLDAPTAWAEAEPCVAALATRLGISDRHLRRIFEQHIGVPPLQYLQTRRLLTAKQLLTDTDLPVTQIALASGFASVRRFNDAFVAHYRLNPTQLRQAGDPAARANGLQVRLGYRPPYDIAALGRFLQQRSIDGVEQVQADGAGLSLQRTLRIAWGGRVHAGWIAARFDAARHELVLQVGDTLREALPALIERTRQVFDLDADPAAIAAVLHADFPDGDGLRVPGAFDGFELAVRAVLGQQVTVAAARTFARRVVARYGEPIATPHAGLTHLFPAPATLAAARPEDLGALGIVRQRQQAIQALARAMAPMPTATSSGSTATTTAAAAPTGDPPTEPLRLDAHVDVEATVERLRALPGIGAWTAQYIAMRALRWPDAFPEGDVALHNALGVRGERNPARAALARAEAWRPWRSYAVIRAWQTLSKPP